MQQKVRRCKKLTAGGFLCGDRLAVAGKLALSAAEGATLYTVHNLKCEILNRKSPSSVFRHPSSIVPPLSFVLSLGSCVLGLQSPSRIEHPTLAHFRHFSSLLTYSLIL